MAEIVAAMASSHAMTFFEPEIWEGRRERLHARYLQRYGVAASIPPQVAQESVEANQLRYRGIRDGLQRLKARVEQLQPDVLVVIADDQGENYREYVPQLAIYTGDHLTSVDRESDRTTEHRCDPELATHLHTSCVDAGFDMAATHAFPEDKLLSHAHCQIFSFMNAPAAVLPIFVNSSNVPAPGPARCYALGQQFRAALDSFPHDRRVVLYASGGLSHFSGGYPYAHYRGDLGLGYICEDFDARLLDWMREGRGDQLATLTSKDLIEHGELELRCWITLMGILGDRRPEWMVYEPFYRAIMGMGVAYWPLN
jgi:hypothetical protein